MDDRDLEARLRARLHARFDDATPPPALIAGVGRRFAMSPPTTRWLGSRAVTGRRTWLVAAAAAVVIATAGIIAAAGLGPSLPPGTTQGPTIPPEPAGRTFVLIHQSLNPVAGAAAAARDVLGARLRALGFSDVQASGEGSLKFVLPPGGPSDTVVERVLSATGDVEIVPLPASYPIGAGGAEVGRSLPTFASPLFGWDGIDGAELRTTGSDATLSIRLSASGADAFATYSAAHVGEAFAVVVDQIVAALPVVQEPIRDGRLDIALAADRPPDLDVAAAIIAGGGPVPETWEGAQASVVIRQAEAVSIALASQRGATVVGASVGVEAVEFVVHAVWNVKLVGSFPLICYNLLPDHPPCPTPTSTMLLKIDAITGDILWSQAPAP